MKAPKKRVQSLRWLSGGVKENFIIRVWFVCLFRHRFKKQKKKIINIQNKI